jgi:predicted methyltransferase
VLRELERASPQANGYLKPGLSIQVLDHLAAAHSDTESARRMQAAKRKLFLGFGQERKSA